MKNRQTSSSKDRSSQLTHRSISNIVTCLDAAASRSTDWRRTLKPSLFALAVLGGLGLADARATPKEFTSGTSLTSAGNYTPTGAPAATDNVVIDSGSPTTGAFSVTAATLNIEDLAFSLAATTSISNTTSTTTASTLELNGGRGTGVSLLDENSTKTLTIKNGPTGALNVLLGASGSFEIDNTGGLTISSNIGEVNPGTALTITAGANGTGVVTLSGTDSFSGGLVAAGGEVDVSSDANLGAASGSLTINGGRLGLMTNNITIGTARNFFVGANPTGGNNTGTLSIKGSITVTYDGAIQNVAGGTGDLVKQGGGTFQLGGVSTYTGNTFLNNGTTQLIVNGSTSTGNLPSTTTLALGQSASANVGAFDLNGINQTVAGLNSISGTNATTTKNTVTSSSASTAATLTLGGSGTYAYGDGSTANSGLITGALLAVSKTGTGTQTLGDANTYGGGTAITGGKLIIAGAATVSSTGTGAVNVGSGGTLASAAGNPATAGTGTVTGLVTTAATSSVLAPGATAASNTGTVGALTLAGGLNIAAGATVPFDLGAGAGASDLITISGGTFTGGTAAGSVVFNFNTTQTAGTYELISYPNATASGVDLSDFAATGATGNFVFNGNELDFTITAVPESATLLGGALLVGVAAWSQRRRFIVRKLAA